MPKIKLTKGELKKQRDSLKRYQRYLPILQLKKQQLQIEILRESNILKERQAKERELASSAQIWAGLLSEGSFDVKPFVRPSKIDFQQRNIAGVDIPVYKAAEFSHTSYDLFSTPLWADTAIESLKAIAALRAEIETSRRSIAILRNELRVTTQRVNLFEKVKIPEAEDTIRLIKIYIGDQMANAVGRSKIAKRKIAVGQLEAAFA